MPRRRSAIFTDALRQGNRYTRGKGSAAADVLGIAPLKTFRMACPDADQFPGEIQLLACHTPAKLSDLVSGEL